MNDRARPRCPSCGSAYMTVGGFVSFHWRGGRLVPQRGSAELADGAPWACQACGKTWIGNYEQPFAFEADSSAFDLGVRQTRPLGFSTDVGGTADDYGDALVGEPKK